MAANRTDKLSCVSRNIRFWRVERRLTIRQLAARIGIDYTRLADWETGRRTIPAEAIILVGDALQVEPGRFFEEPPEKHGGEL